MNQLTTQKETIFSIITKSKSQFELALPKGANVDRNVRELVTLVRSNPDLQSCEPMSLMSCALRVMGLGLELNATLGQAYIIPYGRNAQLQIGYKGMIALAKRSGEVASVTARVVYSNDEFYFRFGTDQKLEHSPTLKDRGDMVGVYAIAIFKDGSSQFEVLSKEEVDKIRNTSKMANSLPWKNFYDEMARKTAIRRLFKYLSISVEMNEAIALDEMSDAGKSPNKDAISAESKNIDSVLFDNPQQQEEKKEEPEIDPQWAGMENNLKG